MTFQKQRLIEIAHKLGKKKKKERLNSLVLIKTQALSNKQLILISSPIKKF